jgi:general secretion pathway protein H
MKYLSKCSSNGYSLLELIVVLVLIGLGTAIITPFLISTLDKTKLQTSAKEIATTLRFSRNNAITTKKPFYTYIDLDESAYWISPEKAEKENRTGFDYKKTRKSAAHIRTIPKEIKIQSIETGSSTVEEGIIMIPFYPQGNTINTKVVLQKKGNTNPEKYYVIHLDEVTGRVRVLKGMQ